MWDFETALRYKKLEEIRNKKLKTRMRVSAVVLGFSSLFSIFMVVYANIKAAEAEKQVYHLLEENHRLKNEIQELQISCEDAQAIN